MSSTTTLRAGVIGAGGIAQEGHIPSLLARDVELVAICDANLGRAEEVAERFGASYAFATVEPLLALPEIDLVTVGLPNALHAPVSVAALEAGKHVLCEKPMALTGAEAQAMIDAAGANGRLLSVNQHMRFDGTALVLRDAVARGDLGEVYLTDVRMSRENGIPGYGSWFTRRDLAGHGALVDIGVHMLDLVLFVLGFPEIATVKGFLSGRLGEQGLGRGTWGIDRSDQGTFDVDDTAAATLTLERGGEIRLHVAWAAFGPAEERLTLYGTRGGADRGSAGLRMFGIAEDGSIAETAAPLVEAGGWSGAIDAFVAALRGDDSRLVRPEETLLTTRVLERIAESAALGRELPLDA